MFTWFFPNSVENDLPIGSGLQKRFNISTASPLAIGKVIAGRVIDTVTIIFTTQFDSLDWQIQVKTEISNVILLDISEPQILDLSEYESNPGFKIAATENIIALLDFGSATEVEGIIQVDLR